MKKTIISHGVDVDGLMSGVLLSHIYETDAVFFTDYPTFLTDMQIFSDQKLVFADLAPSGGTEYRRLMNGLAQKNVLHAVYDHHDWNEYNDELSLFSHQYIDTNKSSAQIIAEQHKVSSDLMQLAHLGYIADHQIVEDPAYHRAQTLQKAIQMALESPFYFKDMFEQMREQKSIPGLAVLLAQEYDGAKKQAIDEMMDTVEYKNHKGVSYAHAHAPMILYMGEGVNHLMKDVDCAITSFSNGQVIVKSKQNRVDVVGFCQAFNGGGRKGGGGFLHDSSTAYLDDFLRYIR